MICHIQLGYFSREVAAKPWLIIGSGIIETNILGMVTMDFGT